MRVAVLIDADNIPASYAPEIFKFSTSLGTIVVRRAHGGANAMRDWAGAARDALCEMRQPACVGGRAKNGTDIALAIDAMDILHGRVVDAFCIVSNDRDFLPLAGRLRESGKIVHAVCKLADDQFRGGFDSILELEGSHPIIRAFMEITPEGSRELSLAETGKLLRERLPGVIPTGGKTPLRKALEETGKFAFSGTGATIRVRLTQ